VTSEELVEFAESLARIAASGGGPKALAARLAQAAGGCVLLEDAQWGHLATAGEGRVPGSARAIVEGGVPGRTHRVAAGNRDAGWLSLFGDSAADAEILLRLTAAAIGIELARNGAAPHAAGNFWESLLQHDFTDAAAARDEAAARGIVLAPQYLAVWLEGDGTEGDRVAPAQLRAVASDAFRAAEGQLGMIEREAALLVFVPAARAVDASNVRTAAALLPKSLGRRKPPLRIAGGVGTLVTPLELDAGVRTAQTALAIARRIFGGERVAAYDELGAYPLLYEGAGVERLRAFSAGVLAPLRAYDEKHQTELERTLKVYFGVGQNVKTAAAQLHVHRHTVFYRLRQIGEISSRSLDAPHDQLTLRLAVAIDELHDTR